MRACTRQPQGPVRIDWSNPLTRGLVDAISFAGSPRSVLTTATVTNNSNSGLVATEKGLAQRFSASGDLRFSNVSQHQLTTDMTLAVFARQSADTGYLVAKMDSPGSANAPFYFLLIGGSPYFGRAEATEYKQWQTTTTAPNGWSLFSVSAVTSLAAIPAFYVSGTPCSTPTVAAGSAVNTATASNNGLIIGARQDGIVNATADITLVYLWNRVLDGAEHAALAKNPWQLFAPQPQWLYTGMGSGSYTPIEVTG